MSCREIAIHFGHISRHEPTALTSTITTSILFKDELIAIKHPPKIIYKSEGDGHQDIGL
jgi:hypothetical protein